MKNLSDILAMALLAWAMIFMIVFVFFGCAPHRDKSSKIPEWTEADPPRGHIDYCKRRPERCHDI